MTINTTLYVLTFVSTLGAGLLAGIFFAFSAFLMSSLSRLPVEQGMTAMQSINSAIVRSWFIVVFMVTTVLSVILGVASFIKLGTTDSASFMLVGSMLIIIGNFLTTAIFNVPLNNALASADPGSSEGARVWEHYLAKWTPWNHVRTFASFAALVSFIIALCKWEG